MVEVLFIALEFPPVNTTGNFRSAKFVKYLERYGVKPIVLTLEEKSGSEIFNAPIDPKLLEDLPSDTTIYRHPLAKIPTLESNKLFSFIKHFLKIEDSFHKLWATTAFWELVNRINEKHKLTAIYVSLPPMSAGSLAIKISKKLELPLLVDMRDAWSQWNSTPFTSFFHYKLIVQKENKLFNHAKKIISVTEELIESFKEIHPNIQAKKFVFIPNGFDIPKENSFQNNLDNKKGKDIFNIGYVGSFYYFPEAQEEMNKKWWQRKGHRKIHYTHRKENWLYRSPYFFLKSLRTLLNENPELEGRVKFHFIGKMFPWIEEMVENYDLKNHFKSYGFLPKSEVNNLMPGFDALLATSELVFGRPHFCLPSKVFDYVNSKLPILAYVTEGSQKNFLKNCGTAILINPDDSRTAAIILKEIIVNRPEMNTNIEFLKNYKRENTAKQLADTIKMIAF